MCPAVGGLPSETDVAEQLTQLQGWCSVQFLSQCAHWTIVWEVVVVREGGWARGSV